jgi:molybdenum cofactor cytidylyltransferase
MSDVAAIILAAGRGTRFGEVPKLLAPLDGKPLVRHAAEAALGSSARPVLVVTGYRADDVETALADLPLQVVRNPSYAEGLSTSLKAGFNALPPEAEAALVLLGDMPLISSPLLDQLIAAWNERDHPTALVPTYQGRRGNPVMLSRILEADIKALSGDLGAGLLLRGHPDVVEEPVEDISIVQDVDTHETLLSLRELK